MVAAHANQAAVIDYLLSLGERPFALLLIDTAVQNTQDKAAVELAPNQKKALRNMFSSGWRVGQRPMPGCDTGSS